MIPTLLCKYTIKTKNRFLNKKNKMEIHCFDICRFQILQRSLTHMDTYLKRNVYKYLKWVYKVIFHI